MELQFNKSVIPCMRSLTRETQIQEQTQDVRITEEMPDLGSILACWGQLLIRGKEWRGSGMSVSGGVMTWVLCEPEDGGEPYCVESWLPFQMKWNFSESERDGNIHIVPLLRGVDARVLSARKLMVRAGIGVLGEALLPGEIEAYEPGEIPEDVCLLKQKYPVQLPREAGEKAFVLEESLAIPASAPQLDKIIRYELRSELTDRKIVSDKVVFRGVAVLHILYRGVDGQLHTWDFDIPFSQYSELDREYDPDSTLKINLVVTNLEVDRIDEENLLLKAGLSGQYIVYDQSTAEIVSDAYSPRRQVNPERMRLQLPSVLDCIEETIPIQQNAEADCMNMIDMSFYPEHPRVYHDGDEMVAEVSGVFNMLYSDENGEISSQCVRCDSAWKLPADSSVKLEIDMYPTGKPQAVVGSGSVTAKSELRFLAMISEGHGIPMVTSMEISDIAEPDPGRPSLILCRVSEAGLWDLAKQAGSTVELIEKANGLTEEPEIGRMLLIPVV